MKSVANQQINRTHQRSSKFFAYDNLFKPFSEVIKQECPTVQNIPFQEITLKCCGYGYFEKVKKQMKKNFFRYLEEVLLICHKLKSLKIIFNGFDVDDESIMNICAPIEKNLRSNTKKERNRFKVLHIHTTNLKFCKLKDLEQLLSVMDLFGQDIQSEEISVQLTDWNFTEKALSYDDLSNTLQRFYNDIIDLKFKRFRLQLSTFYNSEKQAYNFLKDSMSNRALLENFRKIKYESNTISQQQLEESFEFLVQNLDYYITNKNKKFKSDEENDKKQHQSLMKQIRQAEQIISQNVTKYPTEYIMGIKQQAFHAKMITFLGGLLYKLPNIEQYYIDLRNWHASLNMPGLKKILDTKVSSKQEFSLIRRSFGLRSRMTGIQQQTEQAGLKTIYTM